MEIKLYWIEQVFFYTRINTLWSFGDVCKQEIFGAISQKILAWCCDSGYFKVKHLSDKKEVRQALYVDLKKSIISLLSD